MRALIALGAVLGLAAACGPDAAVPPGPGSAWLDTAQEPLAVVNEAGQGPWVMAKWSGLSRCTNPGGFYCLNNVDNAETLLGTLTFVSINAEHTLRLPGPVNLSDGSSGGQGDKLPDAYEVDDFFGNNNASYFAMSFSGYLKIPPATPNNYSFAVGSDDGYRLRIHNLTLTVTDEFSGPRSFGYANDAPGNTPMQVVFPNSGGMFPFDLVWFDRTGAAGVEWIGTTGLHASPSSSWPLITKESLYAPDLRVTMQAEKVPGAGDVASGSTIKWTVLLRNVGQTPAYPVQGATFPAGGVPDNGLVFSNCMDAGITWTGFGTVPSGATSGTTTTGCASTRAYVLFTQPINPGDVVQFDYTTTVSGNDGDTICDQGFAIGSTTEVDGIGEGRIVRYTDDPAASGTNEVTNSRASFEPNAAADDDTTCVTIGDPQPGTAITSPTAGATIGDAKPQIQGTAPPDAKVEVVFTGPGGASTLTCTATADNAGEWNCTPSQDLADGQWQVTARVKDTFGNIGPAATVTFTVDSQLPGAPTLDPVLPTPTNDATPTFTGIAETGTTVEVVEGSTVICTAPANGPGGAFSCTPSTPLQERSYTVTAHTTDATGTGPDSNAVTFVVDTGVPNAPTLTAPSGTTTDATPAFSGTAEAGATVTVKEGSQTLCTTTANQTTGAFSCDSTATLGEGSHTVQVTATDAAQNTSAPTTRTFTVDANPPGKPTLNPVAPNPTNDATPTFTGTAEAGATVTILQIAPGAATLCTTNATGGGTFSCTPSTALGQGSHTVKARATDGLGRSGPDSEPVTFVVDTLAPAAPTLTGPAAMTNDATPAVTGTAEAGATVTVKRASDGAVLCTTSAGSGGAFSCEMSLPDGSYTVQVTATDAAQNTSPATSRTFTVDTVAPARPRIDPIPSPTAQAQPVFSGSCENNVLVLVRPRASDGTLGSPVCTRQAVGTTWSCSPATPLAEGPHTMEAEAQDAAANRSAACPAGQTCENQTTFTVDTSRPAPPIFDPVALLVRTSPPIAGSAEAGLRVRVREGSAAPFCDLVAGQDGRFTCPPQSFADGSHTVLGNASDGPNVSEDASLTFVLDGTPPAAPTLDAVPSPTRDNSPVLSGEAEAGAAVRVLEGVALVCAAAVTGGTFSCSPATPFANGEHTLAAEAVDAAGNVSPRSPERSFVVDTTPPAPPVLATPPGPTVVRRTNFTGTAEPLVRVTVSENTSVLCGADVGADGKFTCTAAFDLAEGDHTAHATARDTAGNESAPSVEVQWEIDLTPPPAPVIDEPQMNAELDRLLEVKGHATGAARVELLIDRAKYPASAPVEGKNWRLAPERGFPLDPGKHTMSAAAVDAAGNRSAQSPSVAFTVLRPPGTIIGGGCSCGGSGAGLGAFGWGLALAAALGRARRRR